MATATETRELSTRQPQRTALTTELSNQLSLIESIVDECALSAFDGAQNFQRSVQLARGMKLLKQALTPEIMKDIVELQGSSLGFRTDRDAGNNGPYAPEVVKECLIEAVLKGARPVGNEFNIISSRAYMTKEFFTRAVREFPGLTDLKLMPGVPVTNPDKSGALVPYVVTWRLNGTPQSIERMLTKLPDGSPLDERIPIRVNSGMGADAIIGKATRKILAAVHARLTGSDLTDGEADDAAPTATAPAKTLGALTSKLNGNGAAAVVDAPPADTQSEPVAEDGPKLEPDNEHGEAASGTSGGPEDGPTWDDLIQAHRQLLANIHSVNDCNKITRETIAKYPEADPDVVAQFEKVASERVEAIRSARGK